MPIENDLSYNEISADFKVIKPHLISENPIQLIGHEWMLITAGNKDDYNTMTASWGSMGMFWNKPVIFIFIRPQRYTFEFVEREEYFTCCFFDEEHHDKLNFCGNYSGRDYDKAKEANLTPVNVFKSVAFKEAKLIVECRKIYSQDIDPNNIADKIFLKHYPDKDYHRMYIGEITSAWVK
jgi:flavin reductase (DIM6/NTAB) family NADH-FMN oxidoreductase RutF